MARKLVEEFEVRLDTKEINDVKDYEAFSNKILLDELRSKIIQNLIDHNVHMKENMNEFVKKQIDLTIEGYDLSDTERTYLYNLIDNEINGYGPISELLKDPDITEIMVNEMVVLSKMNRFLLLIMIILFGPFRE